jgi:hypothetical protein
VARTHNLPHSKLECYILPHEELCPEGVVIEAEKGISVCNALLANDIEIFISRRDI